MDSYIMLHGPAVFSYQHGTLYKLLATQGSTVALAVMGRLARIRTARTIARRHMVCIRLISHSASPQTRRDTASRQRP